MDQVIKSIIVSESEEIEAKVRENVCEMKEKGYYLLNMEFIRVIPTEPYYMIFLLFNKNN